HTGNERVAGDNHLIAWSDAQSGQGNQQGRRARIDGDRVAHLRQTRDLLFHLVHLALEARIHLRPHGDAIAKEVAAAQHVEHFLYLVVVNELHPWSWHLRLLSSTFWIAHNISAYTMLSTVTRAWLRSL